MAPFRVGWVDESTDSDEEAGGGYEARVGGMVDQEAHASFMKWYATVEANPAWSAANAAADAAKVGEAPSVSREPSPRGWSGTVAAAASFSSVGAESGAKSESESGSKAGWRWRRPVLTVARPELRGGGVSHWLSPVARLYQ